MAKETGKAFDFRLFKRILGHTKPYRLTFYGVALAGILLSTFAVLTPVIMKELVNGAIREGNEERLLTLTFYLLAVLVGQVLGQLFFNYYANWLGESVIRDVRVRLFKHMVGFRKKYFDNSSLGVLVTRAVADMQRIGEIFSQGFFMIVADLLKMVAAA
ncbi:MAG: ABC transporter transmembrane domain-containing protein, partial [Flavobacteriaceae bacterium]